MKFIMAINKIVTIFFIGFISLAILQCGGGGDGGDTLSEEEVEEHSTRLAHNTLTLATSIHDVVFLSTSMSSNLQATTIENLPCADGGSGSITIDDAQETFELEADNCSEGFSVWNGTLTGDVDGDTFIIPFPSDDTSGNAKTFFISVLSTKYSLSDGTILVTLNGDTVSIENPLRSGINFVDVTDNSVPSFSGVFLLSFDSSTNVLNGEAVLSQSSLACAIPPFNLCIIRCFFDDFDMDTATDADWRAACN